jgi:hypothetical protein
LTESRRIRWAGEVACMEEMSNKYTILIADLKEPRAWKTFTTLGLKEMALEGEDRNHLTQDTEM